MKTKTIKSVLRKKFDEFVLSIEDEEVKKLVKANSIITGGCIASMYLKEPVNDYDIYFTNAETVLAVSEYYIGRFTEINKNIHTIEILDGTGDLSGIRYEDLEESGIVEGRIKLRVVSEGVAKGDFVSIDEENGTIYDKSINPRDDSYRPIYISANAITLSHGIQLIVRFFGDAEEIHSNYDFVHCTNYWESKSGKLTNNTGALECLLSRELRYQGSKYPLASIIRTRKFIKRGYTINAGQYLKMAMQLNGMDLTDINVLEDQLTGVDMFYFMQLLESIPESGKIDGHVDANYVIGMIDKFF